MKTILCLDYSNTIPMNLLFFTEIVMVINLNMNIWIYYKLFSVENQGLCLADSHLIPIEIYNILQPSCLVQKNNHSKSQLNINICNNFDHQMTKIGYKTLRNDKKKRFITNFL